MPKPPKNPIETVRGIAAAVSAGEITQKEGARRLGITAGGLRDWMMRHGYRMPEHPLNIMPTERDLKAMREYWRRDCTQRDVMEFTGRSYPVVHRWIEQKLGKEN